MQNKNLLIAAAAVTSVLFLSVLAKNYLVENITRNVMQELKRSYTPGPYDPGFDPDKVNPNSFRQSEFSTTELKN